MTFFACTVLLPEANRVVFLPRSGLLSVRRFSWWQQVQKICNITAPLAALVTWQLSLCHFMEFFSFKAASYFTFFECWWWIDFISLFLLRAWSGTGGMTVLLFAWLNWLFSTGGSRGGAWFFCITGALFLHSNWRKKIFAYVPPVFCGMLHDLPLAFCICCSCTAVSTVRSGTPLSCCIYNQTGIPPNIPDCSSYSHRLFFLPLSILFFYDCWIAFTWDFKM